MPKQVGRTTNSNAIAVSRLVKLLEFGIYSVPELANQVGINRSTAEDYVNALYHAKVVRICAWKADARGYFTIRVFKLGAGEDAPAPTKDGRPRSRAKPRVTNPSPGQVAGDLRPRTTVHRLAG